MATTSLRSVLAEPRAPGAQGPHGRDWMLVGVVVVAALLEGTLVPDVVWRPVMVPVTAALAFTLPWRRTHPLAAVAVAFGTALALDITRFLVAGEGPLGLGSMVFMLLLPYALVRWASGREVVAGVAIITTTATFALFADPEASVGDVIGSVAILLTALAIGAAVRAQATSRSQERQEIRARERERLARELHDTVAHHVSAIAVQAQAGRTVAATRPDVAVEALEVIESTAAEALAEMRAMVRILRDGEAERAPVGGVADLPRLAEPIGDGPAVHVEVAGDLGRLPPAVDAAGYRLAQESITNARRHARDATRVDVRAVAGADALHLSVCDDGDTSHLRSWSAGYGLTGMDERARLLGGTCEVGPDPGGGWAVRAVLPVSGGAT